MSLLVDRDLSLPLFSLSLSILSLLSLSFSVCIVVSFPSLSFPVPPFLLSPSLSAIVADWLLSVVSFFENVLVGWLPVVELLVFSEQSPHELV